MTKLEGGCLCGQVRYSYDGTVSDGIACHCSHCRKYTGTAASLNYVLQTADMKWLSRDTLTKYVDTCDKGKGPNRWFCKQCGSPICTTIDYDDSVLHLKVGSLDNFDSHFNQAKIHLYAPQMSKFYQDLYGPDAGVRFDGMPA